MVINTERKLKQIFNVALKRKRKTSKTINLYGVERYD